jgi:hypothetical protein
MHVHPAAVHVPHLFAVIVHRVPLLIAVIVRRVLLLIAVIVLRVHHLIAQALRDRLVLARVQNAVEPIALQIEDIQSQNRPRSIVRAA